MDQHQIQPNVISYGSAISACAKGQQPDRALQLLDMTREQGIAPNIVCYSAAIDAMESKGSWEMAMGLLEQMESEGIAPNVVTFTAAVSACASAGRWNESLQLIQDMQSRGLQPNVVTYSAVISACANGGEWEKALEVLRTMEEKGIEPTVISYNAALSASEKGGQWQTALDILKEMGTRNVAPDQVSFQTLCSVCFRCERYYEGRQLIHYFQSQGLSPNFSEQVEWDLHHTPLSTACLLISEALYTIGSLDRLSYADILVITGKGHRSIQGVPVLQSKVPPFLEDEVGISITRIPENEGAFWIKGDAVEAWKSSEAFVRLAHRFASPVPQ